MSDTSDEKSSLHCPDCGYNLTGLPENRCPECGRPFDPEGLTAERRCHTAISGRELMFRVLWPPGALLLCWCSIPLLGGVGMLLTIGASAFLVVYGLLNAWDLGQRIAVTRARKRGCALPGTQKGASLGLLIWGLYVLQLLIGFGGMIAALSVSRILSPPSVTR